MEVLSDGLGAASQALITPAPEKVHKIWQITELNCNLHPSFISGRALGWDFSPYLGRDSWEMGRATDTVPQG